MNTGVRAPVTVWKNGSLKKGSKIACERDTRWACAIRHAIAEKLATEQNRRISEREWGFA